MQQLKLRWRSRCGGAGSIAIFLLILLLLAVGLVMDDATYVKFSNSVGAFAFAAITAGGIFLKPGLLRRTLGYSVHMTDHGWRVLHMGWIALSLARAGCNEIEWRDMSDKTRAMYNDVSGIVWIGLFNVTTSITAHKVWNGPQ